MSKVKFLTILSVVLVVTNLALIGFLLSRPSDKKERPKNYLVKHLNLSQEQINEYDRLIKTHQEGRKASNRKLLELRNKLYIAVLKEQDIVKKEDVLNQLDAVHREQEVLHLSHFEALRKLCKGEQLKQFEILVEELTELFAGRRHKNK